MAAMDAPMNSISGLVAGDSLRMKELGVLD
jgi:hypothetical protein